MVPFMVVLPCAQPLHAEQPPPHASVVLTEQHSLEPHSVPQLPPSLIQTSTMTTLPFSPLRTICTSALQSHVLHDLECTALALWLGSTQVPILPLCGSLKGHV